MRPCLFAASISSFTYNTSIFAASAPRCCCFAASTYTPDRYSVVDVEQLALVRTYLFFFRSHARNYLINIHYASRKSLDFRRIRLVLRRIPVCVCVCVCVRVYKSFGTVAVCTNRDLFSGSKSSLPRFGQWWLYLHGRAMELHTRDTDIRVWSIRLWRYC